MNSLIQCFVLLVCTAFCTSASIKKCRCVKMGQGVNNPSLIADVKKYEPRLYCSKHEVIVTLKDNTRECLDPESNFTKKLLAAKQLMEETLRKRNTTRSRTRTTARAPAVTTSPRKPTAS